MIGTASRLQEISGGAQAGIAPSAELCLFSLV
jgi:hypothetical protein